MLKSVFDRTSKRVNLFEKFSSLDVKEGAVFLQGGDIINRYDTDVEYLFRQESNFHYITGIDNPSCACALNLSTKQYVLFIPKLDDEYALWCGDYSDKDDYLKMGKADRVEYLSEIKSVLVDDWKVKNLYVLRDTPSLIKKFATENTFTVDNQILYRELTQLRLRKSSDEINAMREIGKISADAHKKMMEQVKPGMKEYQLESIFNQHVQYNGCKFLAYQSIVAGGNRGATLHYVDNDGEFKDGDLVLIDAGAEKSYYAADITRTFPVNGKFTKRQRDIYQIVLKAQKEVINAMKPNVEWDELHRLTECIIGQGLLDLGLLKGTIDDIMKNHVASIFLPHGLGHSIGLDVHDPPNRDGSFKIIDEPGIRYLRIRVKLEAGMCMTVEPGLYFIPRMIEKAIKNENQVKFMNVEKIREYYDFGGIRIEDDILVNADGTVEIFSKDVPKEIDEIEKVMSKQ